MRHIKGRDGVIRGVTLLHKGHHIERPLSLVCPLEIRSLVENADETISQPTSLSQELDDRSRCRRRAAENARERIRLVIDDEDECD